MFKWVGGGSRKGMLLAPLCSWVGCGWQDQHGAGQNEARERQLAAACLRLFRQDTPRGSGEGWKEAWVMVCHTQGGS